MIVPDTIVAVDPGKKSGLAEFSTDFKRVWIGYEMGRMELLDHIEVIFNTNFIKGRVLVVSEQFIITPRTAQLSQQSDALKINGTLEWLCHRYGQIYEDQSQATAKKIAKDQRLHDMGLYFAGRGHANDATRHLILALERRMPSVFERDGIFGYNPTVAIERIK